MSATGVPDQINFDAELIASVEGHWSWSQKQCFESRRGEPLGAHGITFPEGVITTLILVFPASSSASPAQISPKWVRQLRLGNATRIHLPKATTTQQ